jgi:hypothetical protein
MREGEVRALERKVAHWRELLPEKGGKGTWTWSTAQDVQRAASCFIPERNAE